MKDIKKYGEDDIYKDAPDLDPNLAWAEEEYWMKIIKNDSVERSFTFSTTL